METMEAILIESGLESLVESFLKENITPDLVGKLSASQMKQLGVKDRSGMMKLRMQCLPYGSTQSNRKNSCNEFDIPKDIIQNLLESDFSIVEISKMLCVSESTVYRKMRMYDLSKLDFDEIEDEALDHEVKLTIQEYPHSGEVMLSQKIPRFRLRDSLHRLDEHGVLERSKRRLSRRVYNVDGVNHLWHIDTNHKLIRWHFFIVGGIDGFSRFITFLQCTDNNTSDTVFKCFDAGVKEYGLPLRVRSDKGLENLKVAEYMIKMRGGNSMITGKSTHNQRIERLWRDVYEGVLSFYYDLFYFMGDNSILDIMNDSHIYALHHVFISKINEKLNVWRQAWASHRIRTIKTSPLRLFSAGISMNPLPPPNTVDTDNYGVEGSVDFEGEEDNGRPTYESPSVILNITERCQHILNTECPKDWTSANHGIDIFMKALSILENSET